MLQKVVSMLKNSDGVFICAWIEYRLFGRRIYREKTFLQPGRPVPGRDYYIF